MPRKKKAPAKKPAEPAFPQSSPAQFRPPNVKSPKWADKLSSADTLTREQRSIHPVQALQKLPAEFGGPAWKAFFKRRKGYDLEDVSGMRDEGVVPFFLDWEQVSHPKGWGAFFTVASAPQGEVQLVVHLLRDDEYVGTVRRIIAPQQPLELDANALRMIASAAIENVKGIVKAVALKQARHKLKRDEFNPKRGDYMGRMGKMRADVLRGAPIYDEVTWSNGVGVFDNLMTFHMD